MSYKSPRDYVLALLRVGKRLHEIQKHLLKEGWHLSEIEEAFSDLGVVPRRSVGVALLSGYALLLGVIVVLGATSLYLWHDRDTRTAQLEHLTQSGSVSFTDTGELVFADEEQFESKKGQYIQDKVDFIEANLRTMEVALYQNGRIVETLPVLAKGKEGSWWETPTGNYEVLAKVANGYSTIGEVWMPYGVQFYGNYLIHGWPHYDDGTPVPSYYSGGCIRLSNDDAKSVFDFSTAGMPILVLEDRKTREGGVLTIAPEEATLPAIGAKAFVITDLSTGEVLLEKKAHERLPVSSLTALMTAVVAHETIYLGRSIKVTPRMLASASQIFYPTAGERYVGLDLLYPLLMQSSRESAKVLASYLGEKRFVRNMNLKASSLEMIDTTFSDPAGVSLSNVSTPHDIVKLLQYVYYTRPFLFDMSKGIAFENVGVIRIGDTIPIEHLENSNEFIEDAGVIGVQGSTIAPEQENLVTVWNISTRDGNAPVGIVILDSEDSVADTHALRRWISDNVVTF